MTLIEMLVFVFIISVGHFLGRALESKLGLEGWFGGCFLGVVISITILHLIKVLLYRLKGKGNDKDRSSFL